MGCYAIEYFGAASQYETCEYVHDVNCVRRVASGYFEEDILTGLEKN